MACSNLHTLDSIPISSPHLPITFDTGIHFILTPSAGAAEIPALLQGKAPPASSDHADDNIGSNNYSKTAVAVVTGGGYEDDDVEMMRDACRVEGCKAVPWLRPDLSKPTPPLGPEYGRHMVARVKACLAALEREGNIEADAVVFY